MNRYIGKVCPYCKGVFTEEDDIVVCSNCEMPHHKECWISNKGCTTFGCTGTIQGIEIEVDEGISSAPKYELREDRSTQNQLNKTPSFCSNCGASLTYGTAFCTKCGTPVISNYNQQVNKMSQVTNVVSTVIKTVMEEMKTSKELDSDMPRYIGTKQEYYMSCFGDMKYRNQYTSWNWMAFLIAPFWAMYRKMYIPGAIVLAVDLVLCLFGGFISGILLFAVAIISGLFANYCYMYDLEKRIEKGKKLSELQKYGFIEKKGDVDTTTPSIAAVVFVLICAIIFVF